MLEKSENSSHNNFIRFSIFFVNIKICFVDFGLDVPKYYDFHV